MRRRTRVRRLLRRASPRASLAPVATVLATLLLLVTSPASAQTVVGHVLDSLSGRPLPAVVATLVDSSGTSVAQAESDQTGLFVLKAPRAGRYRVYVDELAYRPFISDVLSLGPGERVELRAHLQPEPVPLDEMAVRVRRTEERLRRVGFDRRRRFSMGYFVTPEEVEERKPLIATDLVRQAPRVRLAWSQRLHPYVVTLRGVSAERACPMKIVVDGDAVMGNTLDDIVAAQDVLAVEVCSNRGGVGAPVQFRGADAYCGVVLVWTKGR